MKSLRGLVIVFRGEPVTENLIAAIGTAIKTHCSIPINGNVEVTVLDEAGIFACIANRYVPVVAKKIPANQGTCDTAEDNAIIYIAGLMKDVIGTPMFIPTLSKMIADALLTKSKPSSKKLLNALSILDMEYLQVSSGVLEETGFTEDLIKRIKKVYRLHTGNE